ncbi:P-loop NTPase fold protein [Methyloferula stellata]|uniref:P-loop NTPase fold protein n=1 Tax=Methyloferula stellata TaxID=876270 RepID=UPI000362CE78|nr:P-loop NTPase fold protein [Methyloferula stellata]
MPDKAFVIGLSGVPGSGKSTLLNLLLHDFGTAQAVYYDRFDPGMTDAQICDWVARKGDPNELVFAGLVHELTRQTQVQAVAAQRPLVFFETAFGRVHKTTGAFIDFLVWIDTPLEIALSRASLVFLAAQRDRTPETARDFIAWMTRYMQDYPLLRQLYLSMNEKMASTADLILDGTQPAEALAASVKTALAARGLK